MADNRPDPLAAQATPAKAKLSEAWQQGQDRGFVPQPEAEALGQAHAIKEWLKNLEGEDMGHGLVFRQGALVSRTGGGSGPYLAGGDGQAVTFFHYRNLSTVAQDQKEPFHDLMHFGTLKAAYSRAFSKRLLQMQGDFQFTPALLGTDVFNRCANLPLRPSGFGEETIFSVNIKAKRPFFMPDIGQTQFFQNRAVLYACGLFEKGEVDRDLFDEKAYPQKDIDAKVLGRLREKGYDSVAYLNGIEDPESLSLIILDKSQAVAVPAGNIDFPGFRYRFGPHGSTQILESTGDGDIKIVPNNAGDRRGFSL